MSELRLIRALDRIDNLKSHGKWSFRQPKKHRGVGSLTKTHLDYLMDEMVSLKSIYTTTQFLIHVRNGCGSIFAKNANGR